jgi:hypothetical protein
MSKRMAEALRAAKPRLTTKMYTDEGDTFICVALKNAFEANEIPLAAYRRAEKMISNRIWPYYTAEEWLRGTIGHADVNAAGESAVQQWRHKWLDSMVKEFSK